MKRRNTHSGGVLLVVLAIMMVATAVTAGWMMTMTSEIEYVALTADSAKRRIAENNATALVRQHVLANVLTKAGSTGVTADIGGGWGAVTIPNSTGTPLTVFDLPTYYNHFNPGNGGGYSLNPYGGAVSMMANGQSFTRLFQVKSRSSVLSRTPVALHAPSAAVTGTMGVAGQTLLWLSSVPSSLTSTTFAMPGTPGSSILVSNFPFVPQTGSETTSGAPAFNGTLNVVANNSGINSLAVMSMASSLYAPQTVYGGTESNTPGVQSDGEGTVTIDLLNPDLGNVTISGGTNHLILKGQTSAAARTAASIAAGVLILVYQDNPQTNLTTVEFQDSNLRKVVLAIKPVTGIGVTTFTMQPTDEATWRTVFTLENTQATFQLNGMSRTLHGGIQMDQPVVIQGGSLSVSPETDPKYLDRITARDGWLEVFAPTP